VSVAVVNIFDPLPGEGFRPGRYASLCRTLVERGHQVHWYSSGFWHEFKRPRDAGAISRAAAGAGYAVTLAEARPYARNVSWRRLRNHAEVARRFRRMWSEAKARADVVVVSLPPPCIARAAAEWSARTGARFVVDVQDLWPETLRRFWPAGLGWLHGLAFAGMRRDVRFAYARARAAVGVGRDYVRHAAPFLAPGAVTAALHLGADLAAFDRGVRPLEQIGLSKPAGQRWLFLGGALREYLDLAGTAAMMAELQQRGRADIKLIVVAAESTTRPLLRQIARRGLENVSLLGYRPYEQFASIAAACDAALCPVRPDALVFFPNRVFDYFAAALPVLNTVPGELAELLAAHDAGVTCDPADPPAWAAAAERLVARAPAEGEPRRRRGAWVRQFDRAGIIRRFADLLETMA